jgi:uncharacterized protein YhbP (UPF0306 family)
MYKAEFKKIKTMQLATSADNKPWVASVYFVEHDGKYYWLSEPHRRHSKELEQNPNCAVAIVIKEDMPVIGLQAEGNAKTVDDLGLIAKVMPKYIRKYGVGKEFLARAKKGINKHKLYEFTPKNVKIFNER